MDKINLAFQSIKWLKELSGKTLDEMIKFVNDSKEEIELFSVGSEIAESSK